MIAVIGCGNPNRSDDGVAAAVLRLLAERGVASACHGGKPRDGAMQMEHALPPLKGGWSTAMRAAEPRPTCNDTVKLLDAGTDGMAVMFLARRCRTLILVDACCSGSPPGAVFELPGDVAAQPHEPAFTLHDFRWEHALFAGRKMFGDTFPHDVTVLLIEAGSVDFGTALTASVAAAAHTAANRIEAMVRARMTEGASHAG